jgi:Fic family protein
LISTTDDKEVIIMIFNPPELGEAEKYVLSEIEDIKRKLRAQLHEPRRWLGSLRKLSLARNMQGSNSIEGYEADLDDAAAVLVGEEPLDVTEETRLALEGYRNAMTYVLQLCQDPDYELDEQLIKSLHFMMISYDLRNRPGRWRQGPIFVRNDETGETVHEGADIDDVPELMGQLVTAINQVEPVPNTLVTAAMAHLNLVMIHPFRDGNGRMARCLQSLILAQNGILSPVFMSIEEYLGRNTQSYYDILAEVGGGSWQPQRDARPWVRYCLTAHLRQARTLRRRVREAELLWASLDEMVARHGLPERTIMAVFDASMGIRVRRGTYQKNFDPDDDVSEQMASRDLRALVEAGMLVAQGEKRGRFYTAARPIRDLAKEIRSSSVARDNTDPFVVFEDRQKAAAEPVQLTLSI